MSLKQKKAIKNVVVIGIGKGGVTPLKNTLKQRMLDHLQLTFLGLFDPLEDIDMQAAIYWVASDYHGGQNSELYSILSTSELKPGPFHKSVVDEGETAEMMYNELIKHFSKEIGHVT